MFRNLRATVSASTIIYCFVLMFVLGVIPASVIIGTEALNALTHGVDHDSLIDAYIYTLCTCCLMLVLSFILGIGKNTRKYAQKRLRVVSELHCKKLWWITTCISTVVNLWMFVKCGFRIPIIQSINLSFSDSMMLRQSFEFLINQNVFTFQLYVLAGLNYAIAATGINRYRRLYIGASLFNILLICSFALAKSPIANVCLIICLFYSLVRPFTINLFKLIAIPVTVVCLLFPMYWATGIGRTTEKNTLIMISERIFFGQWAALPYYFELFDDLRLPYSSVLPPYIKSHLYGVDKMEMLEQVPARYVMRAIIGDDAVDEGGPGVASSFFIGEAYALGGYPAVIAGCVLVVSELWLLSMAFLHFRKTVVSSYIYAFMIFKFCMGLVSGISAFVLSGFTIILFIIISYAMALQAQHGHHYSH